MSDFGPQYGADTKTPYDAPREKRGMSGCLKAFIILGILGVIALLTCCISGFFYMRSGMSTEPDKVRSIANDIIDWDFNDEIRPVFGASYFFVRFAALGEQDKGMLLIADSRYAGAEDVGKGIEGQMRSEMDLGESDFEETELVESGEREILVKGETITFDFDKTRGVDSGNTYWEVTGVVPGKSNPTFVMLKLFESAYPENEIIRRLESIR